jgi:DNA-binding response OmpR family regulator
MAWLDHTATDEVTVPLNRNGSPRRLLIVEDDELIALVTTDLVAELGYTVVGPASTLSEARYLIGVGLIDGALLDLHLNGVFSYEIADLLSEKKIPFFFVTGYDKLPSDSLYANVGILLKPFRFAHLKQAIENVLAKRLPQGLVTEAQRR